MAKTVMAKMAKVSAAAAISGQQLSMAWLAVNGNNGKQWHNIEIIEAKKAMAKIMAKCNNENQLMA
jgi:hypothetical protein